MHRWLIGVVYVGDKYIMAMKLQKTQIEGVYFVTDIQFYLNSEDVRFVDMSHGEVERRQSKRSQQLPTSKLHKLDAKELDSLKAMAKVTRSQQNQTKSMSPQFFNSQDDLTVHKLYSEYYIVVCKKSLFM